jgi:ABC-type transport system substrate-binding protein
MYTYDIDMAKSLLAQAGYPGGSPTNLVLHLRFYTTNYDPYKLEGETLKEQWKEIGVDLDVQVLPFDEIESKIAEGDYDIITGGYTWPNADMLWWYWHTSRVPPGPNRFWWGNAYTDEVIDNTFSYSYDVAFKAIQESQMQIMEDACYLPIVERPFLMPMRVDVKGFRVHPMSNFIWKHLDTYLER